MPIVASFTQRSVMHFSSPSRRFSLHEITAVRSLYRTLRGRLEHVNSVLSALYAIKAPSRYSPCTRQDTGRPWIFFSSCDRTCRTHVTSSQELQEHIPSAREKSRIVLRELTRIYRKPNRKRLFSYFNSCNFWTIRVKIKTKKRRKNRFYLRIVS